MICYNIKDKHNVIKLIILCYTMNMHPLRQNMQFKQHTQQSNRNTGGEF